jgi:hypothetical protein
MKKILIILGIVAVSGFLFLILFVTFVVYEIHKTRGPVLYSCVGMWTRIDEYAHQQEKTNYITFADGQLAMYQKVANQWRMTAAASEISKCEKMQADAYTNMDKNIRNGLNPLTYLDMTNPPGATTGKDKINPPDGEQEIPR